MATSIYDMLPIGERNAISRRSLAAQMGLSDRQLRRQIAAERRAGHLILSNETGGGYYRPASQLELKRFVASMSARGAGVFAAVAAARAALAEFEEREGG